MIALILIVIILFLIHVVFDVSLWAIILGIIGLIALIISFYCLSEKQQKKIADSVVKAELIEEISVYKKKSECRGYSIGKENDLRHHYEYVDKFDHVEYLFRVKYKDGSEGLLKCREGSTLYGELWRKASKYYS